MCLSAIKKTKARQANAKQRLDVSDQRSRGDWNVFLGIVNSEGLNHNVIKKGGGGSAAAVSHPVRHRLIP